MLDISADELRLSLADSEATWAITYNTNKCYSVPHWGSPVCPRQTLGGRWGGRLPSGIYSLATVPTQTMCLGYV